MIENDPDFPSLASDKSDQMRMGVSLRQLF
jgi:hypothetical protein